MFPIAHLTRISNSRKKLLQPENHMEYFQEYFNGLHQTPPWTWKPNYHFHTLSVDPGIKQVLEKCLRNL
jgi:hypothetical protein